MKKTAEFPRAVGSLNRDIGYGDRADEDGGRVALAFGDDIQTPVHPIDQIDVDNAGWAEHHGIPGGFSARGVRRQVIRAAVGFRFDDGAADDLSTNFAIENASEQFAGDCQGALTKKMRM